MEEYKDKIINVPVEDILPNRFQPRLAFDEKELNELSNSILKYGVIQPIVLRKIGDKYEIIAGERRYKATVLAGLKTIPAIINDTDDNTSAEIALLENLQRKNLTVIEEAQSFKKLMDKGFTQDEIATKLGVSQSSIANKVRLLGLPKKVQDALLYNKISERHARSLLSLSDPEQQIDLLNRIVSERLTVRQTEEEISKILNKGIIENDIPEEIKNIIVPKERFNVTEEDEKEVSNYLNSIPDVVSIGEEENKEEKDENINPFQVKFEENIRKIEEQINNQRESYFDNIINNNIKENDYIKDNNEQRIIDVESIEDAQKAQIEENNDDDNGDSDDNGSPNKELVEKPTVIAEKGANLPKMISEFREFINNIENGYAITTSELDLPDKYQIIIEIDKNV